MATTEPEQEAQPVKLDVRRAEPEPMVGDIPDLMLTDAWRAKVLANLAAHGMSLEDLMES